MIPKASRGLPLTAPALLSGALQGSCKLYIHHRQACARVSRGLSPHRRERSSVLVAT